MEGFLRRTSNAGAVMPSIGTNATVFRGKGEQLTLVQDARGSTMWMLDAVHSSVLE